MALVAATIQKQMEAAIMSALMTQHAKSAVADPESHQKTAAAIAQGVTTVLITALQTQAQVLPGIATAGSPAAQTSVSPGVIF
jgi:hypothetical protein